MRLPISVSLAKDLDSPSKSIEDGDLQGLTNGQLLEKIVDMCADRGLLVRHPPRVMKHQSREATCGFCWESLSGLLLLLPLTAFLSFSSVCLCVPLCV